MTSARIASLALCGLLIVQPAAAETLWRAEDAGAMTALIAAAPPLRSGAAAALLRRLALAADAPADAGALAFAAAGDLEQVTGTGPPALDAALALGEPARACALVAPRASAPPAYAAFCHLRAGALDGARDSAGRIADPAAAAWIAAAIAGQPPADPPRAALTPLILAVSQRLGAAPALNGDEAAPALRAAAIDPGLGPLEAATAAEAVVAIDAAPAVIATGAYARFAFSPEQRAAPAAAAAQEQDGVVARALLWFAVNAADDPAEPLAAYLSAARADGALAPAARIAAARLNALDAETAPPVLWAPAGRALCLAGGEGGAWLDGPDDALIAALCTAPADPEATARALEAWAGAAAASGAPATAGLALADALGLAVTPAAWRRAAGPTATVSVDADPRAAAQALAAAAADAPGRVAAHGALALAPGPAALSPAAMAGLIRALRRAGFVRNARMAAIEAAVAYGF